MKPETVNLKKIKVKHRNLGREGAFAQTFFDRGVDTIEFDKRLTEREYFGCAIHECCHIILRDASESDVTKIANGLFKFLWNLGYRRVIFDKKKKSRKKKN